MSAQLHRRTPSAGDEDVVVNSDGSASLAPFADISGPTKGHKSIHSITVSPQSRTRVNSTPTAFSSEPTAHTLPPSAGPYRTSFNKSIDGLNGYPVSPLRSSFSVAGTSHSRTRSISTPYSPPLPSPLSFSFPSEARSTSSQIDGTHPMSTLLSAPEAGISGSPTASSHTRRHSRLHSRNLSIFFPRPGSLPESAIAEDGSQEVTLPTYDQAPVAPFPSSDSIPNGRRQRNPSAAPLGAGFTFGGKPNAIPMGSDSSSSSKSSSRRGHHHKHSLSHNFFSFLEPGDATLQNEELQLRTIATPIPVSPWTPLSGSGSSFPQSSSDSHDSDLPDPVTPPGAVALSFAQFSIGSYLWITGQQVGSLASTGLGYWVVFDSLGMFIAHVFPNLVSWHKKRTGYRDQSNQSYENARIETVMIFSQAVYLMFSAVYICKETVEHVLLSGSSEGHHHHHGDDELGSGVDFPTFLSFISLVSILAAALFFDNHATLVNTTGPSLDELVRSLTSRSIHRSLRTPASPLTKVLTNPYTSSSVVFCLAILFIATLIPNAQQRTCDLLLAALISVVTFRIAYSACIVLGTVLLQTAPRRGLSRGKMEAFLRVMREIERHPQVLHLPAPHIWRLTPNAGVLVITLELHVKDDLGDKDVFALTKWASDRCVQVLSGEATVEATIGVVKG